MMAHATNRRHLISPILAPILMLGLVGCNLGYDPDEVELDGSTGSQEDTTGVTESACDDWLDNDSDGHVDCSDSDCQGTADCVGGGRIIGEPCSQHSSCKAENGDPACLMDWPGGYCTEFCDEQADDCPGETSCRPIEYAEAVHKLCVVRCFADDCREEYHCQSIGEETFCIP